MVIRCYFCNFFVLLSNCSRYENKGHLFFSNDKYSTSIVIKLYRLSSHYVNCFGFFSFTFLKQQKTVKSFAVQKLCSKLKVNFAFQKPVVNTGNESCHAVLESRTSCELILMQKLPRTTGNITLLFRNPFTFQSLTLQGARAHILLCVIRNAKGLQVIWRWSTCYRNLAGRLHWLKRSVPLLNHPAPSECLLSAFSTSLSLYLTFLIPKFQKLQFWLFGNTFKAV